MTLPVQGTARVGRLALPQGEAEEGRLECGNGAILEVLMGCPDACVQDVRMDTLASISSTEVIPGHVGQLARARTPQAPWNLSLRGLERLVGLHELDPLLLLRQDGLQLLLCGPNIQEGHSIRVSVLHALSMCVAHLFKLCVADALLHHYKPVFLVAPHLLLQRLHVATFPTVRIEREVVVVNGDARHDPRAAAILLPRDACAASRLQQGSAQRQRLEHCSRQGDRGNKYYNQMLPSVFESLQDQDERRIKC